MPPQPAGSRERFAQRLSQARGTQRRHWFYGVGSAIGIAASVIIAFLMLQPQSDVPATELPIQQTLSASIAEVKGYYKAQMWSETEFIMELSKNLDPELRQRLLMEVRLVNETPDSIMLDIMKQEIGEWPVLLLDDVMSELDPGRRRHLLRRFEGVQTIVTCTDMSDLAEAEIGAAYRIDHGTINKA